MHGERRSRSVGPNYLLSRATPEIRERRLVQGPERAALVLHLNSIGAVAHGPSRFERDPSTGLRSTGIPELRNLHAVSEHEDVGVLPLITLI